jgi:hypothetical protein
MRGAPGLVPGEREAEAAVVDARASTAAALFCALTSWYQRAVTYTGPKKIVIAGGGIAGLAAADAITAALEPFARAGTLPAGIEILLVEGENEVGGRAMTWDVADPSTVSPTEHPNRHHAGKTPHGIHFLWGSYTHFLEWTADAQHVFSPTRPISTYCAWLTPPDLVGPVHGPGKVVALHVCDPKKPEEAWDPRAKAILEAFQRNDPWVSSLEKFVRDYLVRDVEVDDWLAFLDILFDERNLSPELRWGILFLPAMVAQLGRVEKSPELYALLGGRHPQEVEVSELIKPFYESILVDRIRAASAELAPFLVGTPGPTAVAPIDSAIAAVRGGTMKIAERFVRGAQNVLDGVGLLPASGSAALELTRLLLRDARVILDGASRFDPRRSGYTKNLYKAAFSSPYEFDLATALRDVQMGFRNHQTAKLQVFDGDDAQALWNHIKARIEARKALVPQGVDVTVKTNTWVRAIGTLNGRVQNVELTNSVTRAPRPISTMEPMPKGATTETKPADVIVSTLLPSCLKPLITPGHAANDELRRRLDALKRYANETCNLQLFLDRRIELPFVDPPNATESKPFSISNLEGIFTILVDLSRAWRPASYKALRMTSSASTDFTGTAWELVGAWGDAFVHDAAAAPARYQWPLGTQHLLARIAHDPNDLEPYSVDDRRWALDVGAPGSLPPPLFGEVKRDPAVRARYFDRWVKEIGPLVVQQTLRQIAAIPGIAPADRQYLKDLGDDVAQNKPVPMKYVFSTSRQAETKFFSAEPNTNDLRFHSRFETSVAGLWCAGDWTRGGLNVQAMEGALLTGLHAAAGVIEAMRAGGPELATIRGPHLQPDMVPNGAWDPGP